MLRKVAILGSSLAAGATLVLALAVWTGCRTDYTWVLRDANGEYTGRWSVTLSDNLVWVGHTDMKCACHGRRNCPAPVPARVEVMGFAGFYYHKGRTDHAHELGG